MAEYFKVLGAKLLNDSRSEYTIPIIDEDQAEAICNAFGDADMESYLHVFKLPDGSQTVSINIQVIKETPSKSPGESESSSDDDDDDEKGMTLYESVTGEKPPPSPEPMPSGKVMPGRGGVAESTTEELEINDEDYTAPSIQKIGELCSCRRCTRV